MKALIAILQDRDTFLKEIADGVNLKRKLIELNVIAAVSFAVYGAIIGSQLGVLQALSSCIKLPILFLLTTAICMPTLFIFSSFFGSKRSLLQTFVLLATGTAIIGVAMVGFAPITLFFIVTTRSYQFFKLMNVAFFAVSGLLGVLFFNRMYVQLSEDGSPAIRSRRMFLRFWLLLFAFVGTQLAWTLRPFFGAQDCDSRQCEKSAVISIRMCFDHLRQALSPWERSRSIVEIKEGELNRSSRNWIKSASKRRSVLMRRRLIAFTPMILSA